MSILETRNLRKIYGSGDTEVRALDGVNLSVDSGEFVAIVGTSGSGKSTLLHMLGGLDRPTSGSVIVDGKDIFSLKDEALTIFRRRKDRLCLPELQSGAGAEREGKHRPAHPAGRRQGGPVLCKSGHRGPGAGAEAPEPAQPALWGTAAARGHRRALVTKPAIILADEPQATWTPKPVRTCSP